MVARGAGSRRAALPAGPPGIPLVVQQGPPAALLSPAVILCHVVAPGLPAAGPPESGQCPTLPPDPWRGTLRPAPQGKWDVDTHALPPSTEAMARPTGRGLSGSGKVHRGSEGVGPDIRSAQSTDIAALGTELADGQLRKPWADMVQEPLGDLVVPKSPLWRPTNDEYNPDELAVDDGIAVGSYPIAPEDDQGTEDYLAVGE